ncbi:MAG: tetratricopeptide repeat protein [Bacteroidia bacterium]|nr:tetratricopeptide repeat protein [Bacteroidia bacterium]
MKRPQLIKFFAVCTLILLVPFISVSQKKDTARVLDPDIEFYKQGVKLMDSLRYKEAIKIFQKAIKENPMYFQAFNKMAMCKARLRDFKGAEKDLAKSMKIQPDDHGTLKYLGIVYLEDMKYDSAKKYLDSAKALMKDDQELEFYSGNLKFIKNDYKGAIANYTQAIFLKENYGEAYLKRGYILFKQQNYKNAIKDLTRGLELSIADSSNVVVIRARADSYFEMGDFNSAIKDYSRIVTVDPNNEEAYAFRGAAKIEVKDFSGAIDDETKAIDINKNSFIAYNFRGVAKGGLKTFGPAIADFDMSIKIKGNYASAFVNRASVKFAMGQKKSACDDLYKADTLGSNIAYKYIESYCKDLDKK